VVNADSEVKGKESTDFRQQRATSIFEAKVILEEQGRASAGLVACLGVSQGDSRECEEAPRPPFDVAHSRPPCDSTIERLIASPMPVP